MTRELEKNIFISSSGGYMEWWRFLRLKSLCLFSTHWPLSPIFYNQPQGEVEKESFIHLLAARTADFNYGSSSTEEKTHIGKKKAMSHFQIKKTFLHVSITHRLLPFMRPTPSKFSSLSSVVAKSRPLSAVLFIHPVHPHTPQMQRFSGDMCTLVSNNATHV